MRGPSQINLTGVSDGAGNFGFSATAADSANWTPGTYWYAVRAVMGDDAQEIQSGQIMVRPNIMASSYDGSTDNEKALAAIDAVLAKRASIDQERYKINNRELWRMPVADLLKLRTYYAIKVAAERGKATGRRGWGRQIQVKFS